MKADTVDQLARDRVTIIRWLVDSRDHRPSEALAKVEAMTGREVRRIVKALEVLGKL
jgi:hypothetical protein